jgi:hypothetical protein
LQSTRIRRTFIYSLLRFCELFRAELYLLFTCTDYSISNSGLTRAFISPRSNNDKTRATILLQFECCRRRRHSCHHYHNIVAANSVFIMHLSASRDSILPIEWTAVSNTPVVHMRGVLADMISASTDVSMRSVILGRKSSRRRSSLEIRRTVYVCMWSKHTLDFDVSANGLASV